MDNKIIMEVEKYKEVMDNVVNTLNEAFDKLAISNSEDYILFLINGEFNDLIARRNNLGLTPYTIDYRIDDYNDMNRLTFLCNFLNKYYTFEESNIIDFDTYRMNIETMIYTHIWESKPFLKNLYRLTSLLKGDEYNWKVKDELFDVRSNFLRNHIIQPLSKIGSSISMILKKGYKRELRNAFAHSEYHIEKNRIVYFNGKANTIEEKYLNMDISDWMIHFAYSFSLSYWFSTIKMERRKNLTKNFNSDRFWIKVPDSEGNIRKCLIETVDKGENFNYVLNQK